jgi:hypothetical protein
MLYFIKVSYRVVLKYGERIAMHRIACHALWAASIVVVLHSMVAAAAMIRRSGLDFVVIITHW